ncbi:MAG: ABC transporter permease [Actinomycetota bacterium]|nr:ABC transporter permease [Actinomycetota bacterium]
MSRRLIVEPRGLAPWWLKLLIPIASVIAALTLGALFLMLTGNDWLDAYGKMVDTAFGSSRGFAETLVSATPLILTGVAAAIAFKMLVWNIGGEGQLLFGAIVAGGVGVWLSESTPPIVAIAAVIIAGAIGGAFWASLSAVPKVYLGTNEIITTLMLNFIALLLINYLVFDSFSPWRDPESAQFPQGRPIIENARIPEVLNRLDWGFFIAVAVAIFAWFVISKTRSGFEYRIVGDSFDTARYAGIKVPKKVLGTFLASGAAAGLAGSIMVAGILGRMDPRSLDLGLGFTGIIVAALARLNPIAIIPVAVLMGALHNAGPALQSIGIPSSTVTILQGAILLFAVAGEFLISNRIRRPERSVEETTVGAEVSAA